MNLSIFVAATIWLAAAFTCSPAQAACSDANSEAEMYDCAARDLELADGELNAIWPSVRNAMKAWDERLSDYADAKGTANETILKGQRAWIDYRDSTCRLSGFESRGGTMESLIVTNCLADLTQRRVGELRALIAASQQ
jgi:uncharacterized protein YecT (DUF1311 family)